MREKLQNDHERREERKEKRKAKKEKFRQEHPILADLILKVEVTAGVVTILAVPYFFGRSTKYDDVRREAEETGYLNCLNEIKRELGRDDVDYIDDEGKYHQDLHFGAYAVWKDRETYLNMERARLDSLPEGYPR